VGDAAAVDVWVATAVLDALADGVADVRFTSGADRPTPAKMRCTERCAGSGSWPVSATSAVKPSSSTAAPAASRAEPTRASVTVSPRRAAGRGRAAGTARRRLRKPARAASFPASSSAVPGAEAAAMSSARA